MLSQYRAQSCGIRSRWISETQIPSLRSKIICTIVGLTYRSYCMWTKLIIVTLLILLIITTINMTIIINILFFLCVGLRVDVYVSTNIKYITTFVTFHIWFYDWLISIIIDYLSCLHHVNKFYTVLTEYAIWYHSFNALIYIIELVYVSLMSKPCIWTP